MSDPKKPPYEESHTHISNVSTRIFGFEVGKHVMDIEAKTEQEAMQKLVKIYWHFIDDIGEVKLLGAQDNVC